MKLTLDIINRKGLHARASAKFVECVEARDATASVSRNGETVSGDSIMGLMMLEGAQGTQIQVVTHGPESAALADDLTKLLADKFGEGE
ncbi:phosphocarrier protein [Monaibacterium marinum]|uniref:Phosphocarrier protein n=1 Tax=Pontivivens marinum TaxID=1690039 RepID=A0A2C9CMN1_9RHOB|nr:HPr family phosphocarrier protein [Monaibacterium marinum]SOH92477.1 phosphocarrier protein [Monaibacterium marinum]